jgi:hypothetical protein
MARTVDTSSTFENWRQNYNSLAADVGDPLALTTADKSNVVNAINYIMDQYFYFQDFDYDGSDGATSNTIFSGADNAGNTLAYSAGKILVFKNGALLRSGTDYTATNGTSITLASSAGNSDVIRFSVFTGSYENVGSASSSVSGQWTLAGGTIYNHNTDGIIINADSSITTSLTTSDSIQMDGDTYHNGSVYLNGQNDLRLRDNDSSHYAAIQAPATISANYTLTLPADDGTSGQSLQTDGSGVLSWAAAGTAPDITIAANNSANETVYPVFVDGATGTQGLESDTGLTYNPSTGTLTSTIFVGALTGNVTGNVTGNTSGTSGSTTGNAATATALASGRTIGMTGDVVWTSASFDGSGNVTGAATIQTDAVDIGMLSASGTASSTTFLRGDNSWVVPTDTNTTYSVGDGGLTQNNFTNADHSKLDGIAASATANAGDITAVTAGSGMSGGGTSGGVTLTNAGVTSIVAGSNVSISGATGAVTVTATDTDTNTTYSAGTNMSLSGTTFSATDTNTTYSVGNGGLTEINFTSAFNTKLSGIAANATVDQTTVSGSSGSCTGLAASATVLATARLIGGVSFNGSANITLPGVNSAGTMNTSGLAGGLQSTPNISVGTISASGTISGTAVTMSGDITSNTSSDMTLKENIINIPNPLEKIAKIGGYMFDWKDHGYEDVHGKGHDTGIIAQEIEAILPEIVNTRESGIKGVNYMKLIPLLIESIKELKTELDKLKSSNS